MIIGIDETGNFDATLNLRHLFIAAFIESENGKLAVKRDQFTKWENNLSTNFKTADGEVKGSLLKGEQLLQFLQQVVFQIPIVRTSIVSVMPAKTTSALIDKHYQMELKQVEYSNLIYKTRGSKKYNLNFLENYVHWLRKRSLRDYLKMHCLKHLLKDSFNNAIIHAALQDRVEELLDISFKVDRDFLTEENIFWEHYSKTSIENYTKDSPFIVIDTWDENHPFTQKYIFQHKGKSCVNIRTAYKNLKFLDSKDHFEIRIADIMGIIYNRFYNRGEVVKEFELLEHAKIIKDAHIEIGFMEFDAEKTFEILKSQID